MSNDERPVYTASTIEIPLDLTIRRSSATMNDEIEHDYDYSRIPSRSNSLPSHAEFQYFEQYNVNNTSQMAPQDYQSSDQYPEAVYHNTSPHTMASSSCSYSTNHQYNKQINASPPSHMNTMATASGSCQGTNGGYYESNRATDSPVFDSCIIPKKRKNLWRPYDSKNAVGLATSQHDRDRDSDASYDSGSGSSSDQEFKTPSPPIDPVKKRKMNMLQYSAGESPTDKMLDENIPKYNSEMQQERRAVDNSLMNNRENTSGKTNEYSKVKASNNTRPFSEELSRSQRSVLKGQPDNREKIISGMKKRDIFGWSLKLQKPPGDLDVNVDSATSSSQKERDDNRVCQDGDKTYIELQTVKKSSSDQCNQTSTESKVESTSSRKAYKSHSKQTSPNKHMISNKNAKNKNSNCKNENTNEEEIKSEVGKKVYIQRRDNVIESYDETKNVSNNLNTTKKGLCLIDLIEEIEADALKNDKLDIEKTNNRNRSVAALLEQCNYVKLQALDYLMGNILIQDREPQFKSKNEKVQRMLKGDKIVPVNMLDVVELQVEMGLN